MNGTKYDVFLSYAHADAQTEEQKTIVLEIKDAIAEVLQEVLGKDSSVFLDSEALGWGDEWSAKIRRCIDNAEFFVYLLSPNYLNSSYCQREKLWWARHEIRQGRLNKDTRPIYYVRLPEIGDSDIIQAIKEQKICQADGRPLLENPCVEEKPFFASLDEMKIQDIKARLDKIKEDIRKKLQKKADAGRSICSIRKFNESFAGRLMDLARLNQLCQEKGTIPVISGDPGIGKSELAITYSYAYAEDFPQGRFFIPMQGVEKWSTALSKLVEQLKIREIDLIKIGLPENLDKKQEKDKGQIVWNWLRHRAKNGQLLLLLDNLENLDLLDSVPDRWSCPDNEELPIRIIATTRLEKKPPSEHSHWELLVIEKLDHKDSLELFCSIGGNIFPFASWPFTANGKLLLDELPSERRPSSWKVDEIEKEFDALIKIIDFLHGLPWSLEIVAGFMARNPGWRFQEKLRALEKNPAVSGEVFKNDIKELRTPKRLLQPTLEQLQKFDQVDDNLGHNMLWLAAAASFFPSEQVPLDALEGIWKQKFGDKTVDWDDGRRMSYTSDLALEMLREYRIVTGEGPILKMHRLTQDVLQSCYSEEEQKDMIDAMHCYLKNFLSENSYPAESQLLSWCGWADKILHLPEFQKNDVFWETLLDLARSCYSVFLGDESKNLLSEMLQYTEKSNVDFRITAECHLLSGWISSSSLKSSDAERSIMKAQTIYRTSSQNDYYGYDPHAMTLKINCALVYSSLAFQYGKHEYYLKKAITELENELSAYKILSQNDPEAAYAIPEIYSAFGRIYSEQREYEKAVENYHLALEKYQSLAQIHSQEGEDKIAATHYNLASVYNHWASTSKKPEDFENGVRECTLALEKYQNLAQDAPQMGINIAETLSLLGLIYYDHGEFEKAVENYHSALKECQTLAQNHSREAEVQIAGIHNKLALAYLGMALTSRKQDDFENGVRECTLALEKYQALAQDNPKEFDVSVAAIFLNLGSIRSDFGEYEKAVENYHSALEKYQSLAQIHSREAEVRIADTHYNLASVYNHLASTSKKPEDFENAVRECTLALEKYQNLAQDAPQMGINIAKTLSLLGLIYYDHGEFEKAVENYHLALEKYQTVTQNHSREAEVQIAGIHNNLAEAYKQLALTSRKQDDFENAVRECTLALEKYQALTQNNPQNNVIIANNFFSLGEIYNECGNYEKAVENYHLALEKYQSLAENDPQYNIIIADVFFFLGGTFDKQNEYEKAVENYHSALEKYQASGNGPQINIAVADTLFNLAMVYRKQKCFAEAGQMLREAIETRWGRPLTMLDFLSLKHWKLIRHWNEPHPDDTYR